VTTKRTRGTRVAPCEKRDAYGDKVPLVAGIWPLLPAGTIVSASATDSHDALWTRTRPDHSSALAGIGELAADLVPITTLGGTRKIEGLTLWRSHGIPKAILIGFAASG